MKIISVETKTSYYVETDEDEYNTYRRNSSHNWEVLMGESWESVYDYKELEEQFKELFSYCTF